MNKKAQYAITVSSIFAVFLVAGFLMLASAAPKQCNNGVDDDNDGLIDFGADPGCSSRNDATETSLGLICDNGLDESNDADTLADFRLSGGDAGCVSVTDGSEIDGQCDDLANNDLDGLVDFGADPGCSSFSDASELGTVQCDDGADNSDRDTLADYPADAGCSSASENIEINGICDDGVDDASDADSLSDAFDFGCSSFSDTTEIDGQCDDFLDNDGDAYIDLNDSVCTSYSIASESPLDFCNDNDGGITYYTAGNVTGQDASVAFNHLDVCLSSVILQEYYCGGIGQGYNPLSVNFSCPQNITGNATTGGCFAGACFT